MHKLGQSVPIAYSQCLHSLVPVVLVPAVSTERDGLQRVELLGHLLHPAAVDELVEVQRGAAMGALGALLRQPAPDADVAAELRAVRAEVRVPQLLHADEAAEDLRQGLQRMGLVGRSRGGRAVTLSDSLLQHSITNKKSKIYF